MASSSKSVRVVANFSSFSVNTIFSNSFLVFTSLEDISGNRHDDAWNFPTIGKSSEIQNCMELTSFLRPSKFSLTSATRSAMLLRCNLIRYAKHRITPYHLVRPLVIIEIPRSIISRCELL